MTTPEYGFATRCYAGEAVCGDQHLVVATPEGALFCIADGLGHGSAAAEAARAFCSFVSAHGQCSVVDQLIAEASSVLAGTRGAAVGLAFVSAESKALSFAGIGNIEFQAVSREPIRPVSLPGIVGRRVRKTKRFDYAINPGDFFVLHSDGISSRFDARIYRDLDPQVAADRILQAHGKSTDDATCVVFRV